MHGLSNEKNKRIGLGSMRPMLMLVLAALLVSAALVAVTADEEHDAEPVDPITLHRGVSQIGTYKTLHEAYGMAQDGDEIEVNGSVEMDKPLAIQKSITIYASSEGVQISPSKQFNTDYLRDYPAMFYIDVAKGGVLILGKEDSSHGLELNGGGKYRVIYNVGTSPDMVSSLNILSGKITNGFADRGAGAYNTSGASFAMYGGEIKGNALKEDTETDQSGDYKAILKYSKDVYSDPGSHLNMTGGEIEYILQFGDGSHPQGHINISGGTIQTAYIATLGPEEVAYLYYLGGTVKTLLLSTGNANPNDWSTYTHTEVEENLVEGKIYSAASHAVKNLRTGYGYDTFDGAYEAAEDGDTLVLMKDIVLENLQPIQKSITLKQDSAVGWDPERQQLTISPADNDEEFLEGAMIVVIDDKDQPRGVVFTLDGPAIDGAGKYRCLIMIYSTFNMESGTITNGYVEDSESSGPAAGAGIFLSRSVFEMKGGSVTGNGGDMVKNSYLKFSADIFVAGSDVTVSGGTIGHMLCMVTEDNKEPYESVVKVSGDKTKIKNVLLGSSIIGEECIRSEMVYDKDTAPEVGLWVDHNSKRMTEDEGRWNAIFEIVNPLEGGYYYGGALTVEWYDGETPLGTDEPVIWGQAPKGPGTPVRDFDGTYAYTFLGWHEEKDATPNDDGEIEGLIAPDELEYVEIDKDKKYYAIFGKYVAYPITGAITNGGLKGEITDKGLNDKPEGAVAMNHLSLTIVPDADYVSPGTVKIMVGERTLTFGEDYDYRLLTEVIDGNSVYIGVIDIFDDVIDGDVTVTAECIKFDGLFEVGVIIDVPGLEKIQYKLNGDGYFDYRAPLFVDSDTLVELKAVVANGYEFMGWVDVVGGVDTDTVTTDNPYEFKVENARILKAVLKSSGPGPDPNPGPNPDPTPTPKPKPPVITVNVSFKPTTGGKISTDSAKIPLNAKVTVNGDTLIIGSGSSKTIVKAEPFNGFVFDSWSIEDGNILTDGNIVAKFRAITLSGISVESSPAKTEYKEGEKFDPAGLVVIAGFDDMSSMTMGYDGNKGLFTFSPSLDAPLSSDDTIVTVYYNGQSTDVAITVTSDSGDDTVMYAAIGVAVAVALAAVAAFFLIRKP